MTLLCIVKWRECFKTLLNLFLGVKQAKKKERNKLNGFSVVRKNSKNETILNCLFGVNFFFPFIFFLHSTNFKRTCRKNSYFWGRVSRTYEFFFF